MVKLSSVLIIDDSIQNVSLALDTLAGEKYDVAYALDGLSGLKQSEAHQFDCILLDLMMPGMSGMEVLAHMRSEGSNRFTPVIILTAISDQQTRVEGLTKGANDFIVKPFEPEELKARVKSQIMASKYQDYLIKGKSALELELEQKNLVLENAYLKLAGLSEVQNDLLRMISHEINTPLHQITGLVELCKFDKDCEKEVSRGILSAVRKICKLNSRSLLYGELSMNKRKLKRGNCDMGQMIRSAIQRLPAHDSGIIKADLPESVTFEADHDLMACALDEILTNALQNSAGKSINLYLTVSNTMGRLYLNIENGGEPFPYEVLAAFPKPFNLVDTMHHKDGTGLGLAIVYHILDLHGGSFSIQINTDDKALQVLSVPLR